MEHTPDFTDLSSPFEERNQLIIDILTKERRSGSTRKAAVEKAAAVAHVTPAKADSVGRSHGALDRFNFKGLRGPAKTTTERMLSAVRALGKLEKLDAVIQKIIDAYSDSSVNVCEKCGRWDKPEKIRLLLSAVKTGQKQIETEVKILERVAFHYRQHVFQQTVLEVINSMVPEKRGLVVKELNRRRALTAAILNE